MIIMLKIIFIGNYKKFSTNSQATNISLEPGKLFIEGFLNLPVESELINPHLLIKATAAEEYYAKAKDILSSKTNSLVDKQRALESNSLAVSKDLESQASHLVPYLSSKENYVKHSFIVVRSPEKKVFYKKFNNILRELEENNISAINLFIFNLMKIVCSLVTYNTKKIYAMSTKVLDPTELDQDNFNSTGNQELEPRYFKKVSLVTHLSVAFLKDCEYLLSLNNKKKVIPFTEKESALLGFHFGEVLELTNMVELTRNLSYKYSPFLYIVEKGLLQDLLTCELQKLKLPLLIQPVKTFRLR
jgi:hypothetical protein